MSSLLDVAIVWVVIVGIIGVYWSLGKKYKIELENEGQAVSIFGKIGEHFLEGHSFWLSFFTLMFPVSLLGSYSGLTISHIIDNQMFAIIMPYLFVLVILSMFSIVGYSAFTTNGRSRRMGEKILRKYWWNPLKKDNFKSKLIELTLGDNVDRAAVQYIARRGCTASYVAKEVLGTTNTAE
ncbi:MAG: hypothetical protein ACTSV2_08225 [Candidatus Thorarchaeota archaeon]